MTRSTKRPRTYFEFERRVLALVHSYWQVHDDLKLREAAAVLRSLRLTATARGPVSSQQVTLLSGWASRRHGYRISARHLRRFNPGYRVSVRRGTRPDVALSRRLDGIRLGFQVLAIGSIELPPFLFGMVGPDRRLTEIPASNPDAAFKLLRQRGGSVVEDEPTVTDPIEAAESDAPVGYVDDIILSTGVDDRTGNAWLSALAHRHPKEMFEIVESPHGRFAAELISKLFETFTANARWSDRFALSAVGEKANFVSDLTPLSVVRPSTQMTSSNVSAVMLPVLSQHGSVIDALPGDIAMPTPSDTWLRYEDAYVQDGGTLIVNNQLIMYEESADPKRDFVSGQWETVFGSRAHPNTALVKLRRQATESVPEGILLSGRNDANWFHWLIEYLPRVLQADRVIDDEVPVIISSRTPASGISALGSLTNRPVIVLDPTKAHRIQVLHVVAPPVQILDTTRIPWSQGLSMNATPLLGMREAWGLDSRGTLATRRVFLRRNSEHRGLLNEPAIAKIAARHGLDIVDPAALSWEKQKELFSSSELLVGASGAVMANYLLMPSGSQILALTSEPLGDFVLPAAIAAVAGARFSYVTGPSGTKLTDSERRSSWIHSNFSVNEDVFEAALLRALEQLPAGRRQPEVHAQRG